jgi:hypothetical protein
MPCAVALVLGVLLLAVVPVRYAAPRQPLEGTMWQRAAEGIRFIRSRPIVLGTISLDLFAVLLGGVVALLPVYAKEVLHTGPEGLGMLRSSMAVGEVAMGLWLSTRPIQRHVGKVMFAAVAVFGMANLIFSLSHWFWLSLACLAVAGAADMVSVYIRSALVQFSTPDAMRGRVNAVNMLFIGSSNELGEFRAGAMASAIGAVPAAIVGSLCTLGWWAPGCGCSSPCALWTGWKTLPAPAATLPREPPLLAALAAGPGAVAASHHQPASERAFLRPAQAAQRGTARPKTHQLTSSYTRSQSCTKVAFRITALVRTTTIAVQI